METLRELLGGLGVESWIYWRWLRIKLVNETACGFEVPLRFCPNLTGNFAMKLEE